MRFGPRLFAGCFGLLAACGPADSGDDGGNADVRPQCLETIDLECQGQSVDPTIDVIFNNTFSRTCASSGVSCHGKEGKQGGLSFEDPTTAQTLLLSNGSDGTPRVVPGDARCSQLMVRLDMPGHVWSMPPHSAALPEPERCDIRHWIQSLRSP